MDLALACLQVRTPELTKLQIAFGRLQTRRRPALSRMQRGPLLALLLCCSAPFMVSGLSPPWWSAFNLYSEALHRDPCLNVSSLEQVAPPERSPPSVRDAYSFNITLLCANASAAKLAGLATFLTVRYNFGGTLFMPRVYNATGHPADPVSPHSPAHALHLAGAALEGNAWFVRTAVSSPLPCLDFYWVVCAPEVSQVWIDNLADLWGNINMLAADLFGRVFNFESYGIRTTTLKFTPHHHTMHRETHEQWKQALQRQRQQKQKQQQLQQQQHVQACAPGQPCYPVYVTPQEQQAQQAQLEQQERQWDEPGMVAEAVVGQERLPGSGAHPLELPTEQQPAVDAGWQQGRREEWEEAGGEAALQLSGLEQAWRQGNAQRGQQKDQEQQLWQAQQQQQQPQQGGHAQHSVLAAGSRRQLASSSTAWQGAGGDAAGGSYSWDVAAKCWALGLARRVGGERAVVRIQGWLL